MKALVLLSIPAGALLKKGFFLSKRLKEFQKG
jgi:hypothetical protein